MHDRQPEKMPAYNNVRDHFQIEQKGRVKIYGMNVASQLSCDISIVTILAAFLSELFQLFVLFFWAVEGTSVPVRDAKIII